MVGYQKGYSDAYDEGYENGFSEGVEEGRRRGQRRIEFLKVRCVCGYVIPYPIFGSEFSTELHIPDACMQRDLFKST